MLLLDVNVAALAAESGNETVRNDRDFTHLQGLRVRHPVAE